jgi:hypothetical protein
MPGRLHAREDSDVLRQAACGDGEVLRQAATTTELSDRIAPAAPGAPAAPVAPSVSEQETACSLKSPAAACSDDGACLPAEIHGCGRLTPAAPAVEHAETACCRLLPEIACCTCSPKPPAAACTNRGKGVLQSGEDIGIDVRVSLSNAQGAVLSANQERRIHKRLLKETRDKLRRLRAPDKVAGMQPKLA